MNLKHAVRQEREQARRKEPFPVSSFALVGALVGHYRLGWAFVEALRAMTREEAEKLALKLRTAAKPAFDPPLFYLATPEEFALIQAILQEGGNPYLPYARSPEEVLLAPFLWRRRPDLPTEVLMSRHFASLVLP